MESIQNLLKRTQERSNNKCINVIDFADRRRDFAALELFGENVVYHERCYVSFSNIGKVKLAKNRFRESKEIGKSSLIKGKAGRPSPNTSRQVFEDPLVKRSKSEVSGKQLCVIYQNSGGKVH